MAERKFSNAVSLTEEISEILRERILKGEYNIGEKIIENQVATEFRVSRTPIREAFKQLESEGLINSVPNKGCFAKGFTKQDIRDIYEVRKALEKLAVEWAVEKITDSEIVRLQEEYDLQVFYTTKKDWKKVLAANKAFHQIIYDATRSRFMSQILKSYQGYVQQARKATVSNQKNLDNILKEHQEILEAIKIRDGALASEKIGVHLDSSRARAEAKWHIVE